MADIKEWSKTAAANGTPGNPPDWPKENMDKSDVNDTMRENMRAVRDWYEDPTWVEPFETNAETWVYSQLTASSFRVAGSSDKTALFPADRRVRLNGSVETFVTSTAYAGGNNDITVDDATVPATITSVEIFAVAMADSAFTALGTAGATLVLASDLGTAIGQATPLGDAATKTVGSGAGQVGTFGTELGTAATKDHGDSIGDVPLNTSAAALATGAYSALPALTITVMSANESFATTAFDCTEIAAFADIAVPGSPDGSIWYEVHLQIFFADDPTSADGIQEWFVSCGPLGTMEDPTVHSFAGSGLETDADPHGSQRTRTDFDTTPPPTVGNDSNEYHASGSLFTPTYCASTRFLLQPASGDSITLGVAAETTDGTPHVLYEVSSDGLAKSLMMIREIQGA